MTAASPHEVVGERLRLLLDDLARATRFDTPLRWDDEHDRWALYQRALADPALAADLREAIRLEPDAGVATSVVLLAFEEDPDAGRRLLWVAALPPDRRDFVARRAHELVVLESVRSGSSTGEPDVTQWTHWLQRAAAEQSTVRLSAPVQDPDEAPVAAAVDGAGSVDPLDAAPLHGGLEGALAVEEVDQAQVGEHGISTPSCSGGCRGLRRPSGEVAGLAASPPASAPERSEGRAHARGTTLSRDGSHENAGRPPGRPGQRRVETVTVNFGSRPTCRVGPTTCSSVGR